MEGKGSMNICRPLLTVGDVARMLKLAPYTVRKWVRLGQLPAVKLGERQLRFLPDDVNRWVKEQRI